MSAAVLEKKFQFTMPLIKGADEDDGYYYIKFAISTNNPDLEADMMTDNALESMAKQAKGLNIDGSQIDGINIDDTHKEGLEAIIGPVVDSWVDVAKRLWVKLRVRKEWESTIKDLVDSGAYLGGSVYGFATKILEDTGDEIRKIDDVFLIRAALTDTPAAWETRGTAEAVSKDYNCYGSMCSQIIKSLDGGGDTNLGLKKIKKSDYIVNQTCLDFAKQTIADGNIDNGPWKKPSFSDYDNDIDEYKKYALAKHPDGDEKLAGTYGFEIGKNDKISRQGVIAAKTDAAGARSKAGKNTAIYDSADELLQLIDKKDEKDLKKIFGGDNIKKTAKIKKEVIDLSNTFEQIQAEVNEALDDKYGVMTTNGWISRECWLRYTGPDFIIISTGDDYFQIPYTREADDDGDMDVKLGDPVRATTQMITKAIGKADWILKSPKPESNEIRKTTSNIPGELDENLVKKLKGLGDDGKQFVKHLFGFDESEPNEPGGNNIKKTSEPEKDSSASETAPTKLAKGGDQLNEDMINKMIEDKTSTLTKKLGDLESENKSLRKRLDRRDETDDNVTKKGLQKEYMDLQKKLHKDMSPGEESSIVKKVKKDLNSENGIILVKRDISTLKEALNEMPAHEIPSVNGKIEKEISDKYAQKAADIRKQYEHIGEV